MISGSLVALVTPMREDGSMDFACLDRLVDWHVEQGTDALVVAGTTGESATLATAEHVALIEAVVRRADDRLPVIAGTGSNSTAQTVELSRAVDNLPLAGFLVVTPYYNKPTQEGLYRHFSAVADAVSRSVILYNVPGRTGVDLQPETVIRLAAHPRITGIKEATGDLERVRPLRARCGHDFALYSGDDETAREFIGLGGNGVISVTANVAPRLMHEMCRAALSGDAAAAMRLDEQLAALHRDLFVESNPIPVKWALERMGLIPAGIRLPLTRLDARYHGAIESALQRAGLMEAQEK